jgi:CubicO group peptidase (beta-lactamase class C family)
MASVAKLSLLLVLTTLIPQAISKCTAEHPFYPPPIYTPHTSEIWEAFSAIEASLSALTLNNTQFNTSSYSIEVTSSQQTLWSTFHTARDKNLTRPGADKVDSSARYRIASITKVFTVLGILQQHAAGNMSLDDPVSRYISNLTLSDSAEAIPWADITLRSLASQLSGLPRDWAQGDLLFEPQDPTSLGFPPIPPDSPDLAHMPRCDSYRDYKPCTAADLLDHLSRQPPLFAPNVKSTYSNIAFEMLGLVLANTTGVTYEEYIASAILSPLNMTQTSFSIPPDSVAVLPKNEAWYFDVDEGVQNPTGGIYCSSSDMSLFLRYILTDYLNIANTKMNWLLPISYTSSVQAFYGMPWEIFRTERILSSGPVTFFTKGGGLPGYSTLIFLVPEYDLGITIFTAGNREMLDELRERVTVPLVRAAHGLAARQAGEKYAGIYSFSSLSQTPTQSSEKLNSTLTLTLSAEHGLEITNWISNGTDMLTLIPLAFHLPAGSTFHSQLIPTQRYRDETRKRGQKWRIALTVTPESGDGDRKVWEEFCSTDVDTLIYAGKPVNEVVFWEEEENAEEGGRVSGLELTAFRVNLTRSDGEVGRRSGFEGVVVQEL